MACGSCGGKSSASHSQWCYTSPSGQTQCFPTEVEAKAAKIKNGGGTYTAR